MAADSEIGEHKNNTSEVLQHNETRMNIETQDTS